MATRELQAEIEAKLAQVPNQLNEFGYDPFGLSPDWLCKFVLPGLILYRHWFRCRCDGLEKLPAGRMLLVANHAGQLPFDAAMLSTALLMEAEPPRIVRPMGEYFLPRLPFVSIAFARSGALVGTPGNCARMLENDEAVMVFPEGVRGISKTYDHAYELQRFGLGFMRLALETRAPIVPVGIVGSEEQAPGLANLERLGRRLGLPALPITPTFPLLGPLGLIPLPARYRISFGEPLYFEGDGSDEDEAIESKVELVKRAIEALIERGLAERRGIFSG
ncbi:MAG: acyltransferase family protein [Deltaproteobacteria bacterium]|nr:acyltransferase family protein [Deltaproteobacteria bacterium]MBW2361636.1 acyltransferase family protein [Deltaproteobacteria bacterium]